LVSQDDFLRDDEGTTFNDVMAVLVFVIAVISGPILGAYFADRIARPDVNTQPRHATPADNTPGDARPAINTQPRNAVPVDNTPWDPDRLFEITPAAQTHITSRGNQLYIWGNIPRARVTSERELMF
jgi:hypothetical protein